jgi:hypothetical protein
MVSYELKNKKNNNYLFLKQVHTENDSDEVMDIEKIN